jgi:hypothetical protein
VLAGLLEPHPATPQANVASAPPAINSRRVNASFATGQTLYAGKPRALVLVAADARAPMRF